MARLFGIKTPTRPLHSISQGISYLKPLTEPPKRSAVFSQCNIENRLPNNWHKHLAESGGGQLLVCVEGEGWYQEAQGGSKPESGRHFLGSRQT